MRRRSPPWRSGACGASCRHSSSLNRPIHGASRTPDCALLDSVSCWAADCRLDEQIRLLVEPLLPQIEQLDSIPGVNAIARACPWVRLARTWWFGSAARLASWAKISPGNNASAGERRQGRGAKGYLRRVLVQCAWAARKTPTFLGRTFGASQHAWAASVPWPWGIRFW